MAHDSSPGSRKRQAAVGTEETLPARKALEELEKLNEDLRSAANRVTTVSLGLLRLGYNREVISSLNMVVLEALSGLEMHYDTMHARLKQEADAAERSAADVRPVK